MPEILSMTFVRLARIAAPHVACIGVTKTLLSRELRLRPSQHIKARSCLNPRFHGLDKSDSHAVLQQ
jgi:hypothetical protein